MTGTMRRAAPTLPISPRMLRRFAVATVILTALVAMFADGESRDAAVGAIKAREAKNQAIAADAAKFGAPKLHLRAPDSQAGEFGDEPGIESPQLNTFRGAPSGPALAQGNQSGFLPPPSLPMVPGATVTVQNVPGEKLIDLRPGAAPATKRRASFRPDAQQMETIRQNSRERSGNPNGVD